MPYFKVIGKLLICNQESLYQTATQISGGTFYCSFSLGFPVLFQIQQKAKKWWEQLFYSAGPNVSRCGAAGAAAGATHQPLHVGFFLCIPTETCTICYESARGMSCWKKGEEHGMGGGKTGVILQFGSWLWNTKRGFWPLPYPVWEQRESRAQRLPQRQGTRSHSAWRLSPVPSFWGILSPPCGSSNPYWAK